jgi:hypothetical protein
MYHIIFSNLLIILGIIAVFAEYYSWTDNISRIEAYYHSTLIQTLVGDEYPSKTNPSKIATICQSLIAYALTTSFIIYWSKN